MNDCHLIETDIIIYWLKGKYQQINEKIERIEDDCIFISTTTVAELYFGAYNSSKLVENLKSINELLVEINILNFDSKSGEQFGRIKSDLKKKGENLNDSDILIAATALSNNMILVTNNERHFQRIENLRLQNWAKKTSNNSEVLDRSKH